MNTVFAIVLLSSQGHWLAGTEGVVRIQSALITPKDADLPAADFRWELQLGDLRLATGKTAMEPSGRVTELKIVCPQVRTNVEMQLKWEVAKREGGAILASGTQPIIAYPADLLTGVSRLVSQHRLVVIDPAGDLSKLLTTAKVPHVRIMDTGHLQLDRPEVVLVAPDALVGGIFEQSSLLALAKSGTQVLIFRQSRVDRIGMYPVVAHLRPHRLEVAVDHPLLNAIPPRMIESWRNDLPKEIETVQVPTGAGVTSLIHMTSELQGEAPAKGQNIKAESLLTVQRRGVGRLLICQLPIGDWQTDPRSQIFLSAALDYLLTAEEPSKPLGFDKKVPANRLPRQTMHTMPQGNGDR